MEGIILDIGALVSPVTGMFGLVLLGIGVACILLGYMSDEEKSGKRIFWAESPFTDVSEKPPVEGVPYRRAA